MLHIVINEKTMGSKLLLSRFELRLERGEKVGFLGRNGTGKTTLMNLINGVDEDFDGEIKLPKNLQLMTTSQEHTDLHTSDALTLNYITAKLPRFASLHHILESYPKHISDNPKKMEVYSNALQEFSDLGYYNVENSLAKYFDSYQLDKSLLNNNFSTLSGGQKRLAELIAIQLAEPAIALLDEPTNHMDYIGKAAFISWLKTTKSAVLVISHDRDVLEAVDRIVELKDKKAHSYKGNYNAYLAQNATKTSNSINEYEITKKELLIFKNKSDMPVPERLVTEAKLAKTPG